MTPIAKDKPELTTTTKLYMGLCFEKTNLKSKNTIQRNAQDNPNVGQRSIHGKSGNKNG